jgi:competence protein ComEC
MQNDQARKLCADCDLLKLAHHGSRNGRNAEWLELVKPKQTVASCGKDNKFHHPHQVTLDLLKQKKIPLLRTDEVGTITFKSEGEDWIQQGN